MFYCVDRNDDKIKQNFPLHLFDAWGRPYVAWHITCAVILVDEYYIGTSDEWSKQLHIFMYNSTALYAQKHIMRHYELQHHHVTAQSKNTSMHICSYVWIIHYNVDPYICTSKSPRHSKWTPDYSVKDLAWNSFGIHGIAWSYVPTSCIIPLSHNC